MNKTKTYGDAGEDLAERFLIKNGYGIVARNFSQATGEIDIIASQDGVVIFVEVKRRETLMFGRPCEAVTREKQHRLCRTAALFIKKYHLESVPFRFDVIEILGEDVNHIQNAFSGSVFL